MTYVIPKFENEWFFLSNFSEHPVTFDSPWGELRFKTSEAAFQAAKYKAMDPRDPTAIKKYVRAVLEAPTPNQTKYLGRSVSIDIAKWNEIRVECMREVVFQKFLPTGMSDKLLSTGHAMLVEGNTWGDTFWGRVNGKGYNMLGSILMEVRGFYYWSGTRDALPKWVIDTSW